MPANYLKMPVCSSGTNLMSLIHWRVFTRSSFVKKCAPMSASTVSARDFPAQEFNRQFYPYKGIVQSFISGSRMTLMNLCMRKL